MKPMKDSILQKLLIEVFSVNILLTVTIDLHPNNIESWHFLITSKLPKAFTRKTVSDLTLTPSFVSSILA